MLIAMMSRKEKIHALLEKGKCFGKLAENEILYKKVKWLKLEIAPDDSDIICYTFHSVYVTYGIGKDNEEAEKSVRLKSSYKDCADIYLDYLLRL
jgi:hypothetical protein